MLLFSFNFCSFSNHLHQIKLLQSGRPPSARGERTVDGFIQQYRVSFPTKNKTFGLLCTKRTEDPRWTTATFLGSLWFFFTVLSVLRCVWGTISHFLALLRSVFMHVLGLIFTQTENEHADSSQNSLGLWRVLSLIPHIYSVSQKYSFPLNFLTFSYISGFKNDWNFM